MRLLHCLYRTQAVSSTVLKQLPGTSFVRSMSDHLERTASNHRQTGISDATVVSISDASPSVKLLTLQVANADFQFRAGQWVDFFVPDMEIFTGFSVTSPPGRLRPDMTFDLAIQKTDHPPTLWVHEECKIGDKVGVRAGGDQILYDPCPADPSWDLLLIAGGIGINPLYSILQHVQDLHAKRLSHPEAYRPGKVELLYSAASLQELIFKESIEGIADQEDSIVCQFFVTKEKVSPTGQISGHRIDQATVSSSLERLDRARLRCFLCGPPPMIAGMEALLAQGGVAPDQIHCEKWW